MLITHTLPCLVKLQAIYLSYYLSAQTATYPFKLLPIYLNHHQFPKAATYLFTLQRTYYSCYLFTHAASLLLNTHVIFAIKLTTEQLTMTGSNYPAWVVVP